MGRGVGRKEIYTYRIGVRACAELVGLGRAGSSGDIIETQLKLGSQKWKAKCRVSRHEQNWQDEDVSSGLVGPWHGFTALSPSHQIIFLGKIMDELFVKVVEVKKIQGNVLLGNMKCQTREFFSFLPMVRKPSSL